MLKAFNIDEIALEYKVARLALPFIINIFLFKFLKKFFNKHGAVKGFMKQNNPSKTKEELNKLEIFWNNDEIHEEKVKNYKPFLISTPILIGIAGWFGYANSMRFFNRPMVEKVLENDLTQLEGIQKSFDFIMGNLILQKEFLIISICAFFGPMFTYSFVFTLRKINR